MPYVPEGQSEHDMLPIIEYFPGGQFAHVLGSKMLLFFAPAKANFPTLQLSGPEQEGVVSPVVEP